MPSTFGKREREQAKRAKAQAKRERRQHNTDADDTTAEPSAGEAAAADAGRGSTPDVLAMIAELHERYEAGTVGFEEFEATKAELLARIVVD